ncbi:MAG: cation transporter [Proteobacteria bacterium]|nr:cation transporter [Pseudomonadota bacterium]MBU1738721.1 cation transporter [Pseudomonadota bacterium]
MPIVKIKGMRCGHCVGAVTTALNGLKGIKNTVVNLEKGEASYDEEKPVSREEIAKAITAIGFEVE